MAPPDPTTATVPAAAKQKIVAAMWGLGTPATARDIADAAHISYSTATPLLRTMLGDGLVTKSAVEGGPALWQLDLGAAAQESPPDGSTPARTPEPVKATDQVSYLVAAAIPDAADGDPMVADPDRGSSDPPSACDTPGSEPDADATDDGVLGAGAGPKVSAPASTSVSAEVDAPGDDAGQAEADTAPVRRHYRKPTHPRRPPGALRAAVLAVLRADPSRAFTVTDICKLVDAANTDQSVNPAGGGAVANACDKLVGSGDLAHVVSGTRPGYQAIGGTNPPH